MSGGKTDERARKIDRAVFRPGREVLGPPGPGGEAEWKAIIYPMGLRHVQAGVAYISKAGAVAAQAVAALARAASAGDRAAMMVAAFPILTGDAFDLVRQTVTIVEPAGLTVDDLAHWDLPPLVEAFVELNFGEERKRRPWSEALENLLRKLTRTSETPSTSSPQQATASVTSST